MSVFTPFANYPFRVFNSPVQVTITSITLTNDYKKSYLGSLYKLPVTRIQGEFLQTLLETNGVMKVEVSVSRIIVWKKPGYSWAEIHPNMVFLISACPIKDDDIEKQIAMVIEKWNMDRK